MKQECKNSPGALDLRDWLRCVQDIGELTELERAWREAEEIAAISDDLLLPGGIRGALDKLRGK